MNKVYSIFLPIVLLVSTASWACDFEKLKTAVEQGDVAEVTYQLAADTNMSVQQKQILLDIANKNLVEEKAAFEASGSIINKDTIIGTGLLALAATAFLRGTLWYNPFTDAAAKKRPAEYLLTGIADDQKAKIHNYALGAERNGLVAQIPLAIVGLCKLYKGLAKKAVHQRYNNACGVKALIEKHVPALVAKLQ
jgi:hypothetical protein